MWILYAVEHQQQRWLGQSGQHLVDAASPDLRIDQGNYALMAATACRFIEALRALTAHVNAPLIGSLDQTFQTWIVARLVDQHLEHRIGLMPQARRDGVKPVDSAWPRH